MDYKEPAALGAGQPGRMPLSPPSTFILVDSSIYTAGWRSWRRRYLGEGVVSFPWDPQQVSSELK